MTEFHQGVLAGMFLMFVSSIVVGVVTTRIRRRLKRDERRILDWLRAHPQWHYGLDLVRAGLASRGAIYIYLGRLEEAGLVMSKLEEPKLHGVVFPYTTHTPRPLYRATLIVRPIP